jgi:hypothetical protein
MDWPPSSNTKIFGSPISIYTKIPFACCGKIKKKGGIGQDAALPKNDVM